MSGSHVETVVESGQPGNYFDFKWIGTAPICRPNPVDDCVKVGGTVFGFDQDGDGHRCARMSDKYDPSEMKMLCGFPKFFSYSWLGTAPFCASNNADDCRNRGGEVMAISASGDGATCWTGSKVLCRHKNFHSTDVVLNGGAWHTDQECPLQLALPSAAYQHLKVFIRNGIIYDLATDQPFSSLKYINDPSIDKACGGAPTATLYVVSPEQELYLVNACEQPSRLLPVYNSQSNTYVAYQVPDTGCLAPGQDLKIVHSLVIGKYTDFPSRTVKGNVLGAGTIDIQDGRVKSIDNCSGPYKPNFTMLLQAMQLLVEKGVQISSFKNCAPD